jgi:hypothetical protein
MTLRIFAMRHLAPAAFAAWLVALPSASMAQATTPLRLTVTPEVAEPGVARTIRLSGTWPFVCSRPSSISVVNTPFPTLSAGLTLNSADIVFSPCPPTLSDVSLTTTYTPQTAGVLTLTLTNSGQFIAQGSLITRSISEPRAGADLTGAWHDPATPGSGLALYHSQGGSDLMAGALYVYDTAGKPHWLLLQAVRWTGPATFFGELRNVTAGAANCGLLPACANTQTASAQVGRVNGERLADGKLRLAITAGPPFADPPLPETLTLERLVF